MAKSLFLLLFFVGCTNSIVVERQERIPVFEQDRKGKLFLKNEDTLSVVHIIILDNTIFFVNTKTNSQSEVPIDSVSRLEFVSRWKGMYSGAGFGLLTGLGIGIITAFTALERPAPCDEDCGPDFTNLGRALIILYSSTGGMVAGSIIGYVKGDKEIYVFK